MIALMVSIKAIENLIGLKILQVRYTGQIIPVHITVAQRIIYTLYIRQTIVINVQTPGIVRRVGSILRDSAYRDLIYLFVLFEGRCRSI